MNQNPISQGSTMKIKRNRLYDEHYVEINFLCTHRLTSHNKYN